MSAVRVVLAVLLAVAMLGAVVPALDRAADTHTADAVRAAAVEVEVTAAELRLTDDAVPGVAGATRRLDLRLPVDRWYATPLDSLAVLGPNCPSGSRFEPPSTAGLDARSVAAAHGGALRYRLDGGEPVAVPVDVPLCTPGGPVRLGAGRVGLSLSLVAGDGGDLAVLVRRRPGTTRTAGGRGDGTTATAAADGSASPP